MTTSDESKKESRRTLYWAKASRFQLANFVKEMRNQQGFITQSEQSIQFEEHIYATNVPKAIRFIEESRAFKIGRIKKCEDEKMAAELTRVHNAARAGVVKVEGLMDKDVFSRPE